MKTLREAAQAVIDRWDAPLWKDEPATAVFIGALRRALEAPEQEPTADDALHYCITLVAHGNADCSGLNQELVECFKSRIKREAPEPTNPPRLSDEEISDLWDAQLFHVTDKLSATQFVRDVEAALAQPVQPAPEIEALTKERDDLKGSVLGLNRYSAEVNARNTTLTKERDALLAAGKIALDVMARYQVRRQDFDTFDEAITALNQAGVEK